MSIITPAHHSPFRHPSTQHPQAYGKLMETSQDPLTRPGQIQLPPSPEADPNETSTSAPRSAADNQTPTRRDSKTRTPADFKRKQKLHTLLKLLSDLEEENDFPSVDAHVAPAENPSFLGVPNQVLKAWEDSTGTSSEQLQKSGAQTVTKFLQRWTAFNEGLLSFQNEMRKLGPLATIVPCALSLQQGIADIVDIYLENVEEIFPDIPAEIQDQFIREDMDQNLCVKVFTAKLNECWKHVVALSDTLDEFPEFTDEAVNNSLLAFKNDLAYWVSCLKAYEERLQEEEHMIRYYVHDLCGEVGRHLKKIKSSLSAFVEIGIPRIREANVQAADNLLRISTIATFFSAVTATTLSLTSNSANVPLSQLINGFWFTSLVLSIASAVNSLLGQTWMQAMYRSPRHRVPWWILIFIEKTPVFFVVLSVATFLVGFGIFAYSSQQSTITSVLTTVLICVSSFGLVAVSAWLIFERSVFRKHNDELLLMDVRSTSLSLSRLGHCLTAVYSRLSPLLSAIINTGSKLFSRYSRKDDEEEGPGADIPSEIHASQAGPKISDPTPVLDPLASDAPSLRTPEHQSKEAKPSFRGTTHRMIVAQRALSALSPTNVHKLLHRASAEGAEEVLNTTRNPTFTRGLEYSPDGKFLATCGMNSCSIYLIENTAKPHWHLQRSRWPVERVAWSPDSKMCLTKTPKRIEVWRLPVETEAWTYVPICSKRRQHRIHSIAWYPQSDAFLLVEENTGPKGSRVSRFTINRADEPAADEFEFLVDNLLLYDVAIMRDNSPSRMLCVARLIKAPGDLEPCFSPGEKQILIYNLGKKTIEYRVPTTHDVRHVSLSKSGDFALVSSNTKMPPQLWELAKSMGAQNRNDPDSGVSFRLRLEQIYTLEASVGFVCPSYFGGENDKFVFSATKTGNIYIWERQSGKLVKTLQAQNHENDLACVAWNHGTSIPMLASGSSNGTVRIWSSEVDILPPCKLYGGSEHSKVGTGEKNAAGPPQSQLTTMTEEVKGGSGLEGRISSPQGGTIMIGNQLTPPTTSS